MTPSQHLLHDNSILTICANPFRASLGSSQLCTHINAIYTKMMTEFKKWGGDVVKFSGDALLVMFEVYEEERLREMGERRQMGGIEPEEGEKRLKSKHDKKLKTKVTFYTVRFSFARRRP
jgi:hypothetical protein